MLNNTLNKIRQWDKHSNQWFSKNFSVLLFELVLAVIFVFFIDYMMNIIAISDQVKKASVTEQILMSQAGLMLLVVLLLLFNSFLMLYLFNNILRISGLLKNLDYHLGRRRSSREDDI